MSAHLRERWAALVGGKTAARYVFDVDWSSSKDTLAEGEIVSGTSRVVVEADSVADARLVAEQMVAPREPTDARLVEPEDYRE